MKRVVVTASELGKSLLSQKRSPKQALVYKLWSLLQSGADSTDLECLEVDDAEKCWEINVTSFSIKGGELLVKARVSNTVEFTAPELVTDTKQLKEIDSLNRQLLQTWSLHEAVSRLGLCD